MDLNNVGLDACGCGIQSQLVHGHHRAGLAVLGGLNVGFWLFYYCLKSFRRSLPFHPQDGADLNPLLQDFGLIVHPPMLYMGYVGFAVPFALAIATLTAGRLDSAWAHGHVLGPMLHGLSDYWYTLGSWWAYYELGWGGWWFWDAVENASFMPWLVGTALVHSLAASEKEGFLKLDRALGDSGVFAEFVRGIFGPLGVLTSVRTFAVDPLRVSLFLFSWL